MGFTADKPGFVFYRKSLRAIEVPKQLNTVPLTEFTIYYCSTTNPKTTRIDPRTAEVSVRTDTSACNRTILRCLPHDQYIAVYALYTLVTTAPKMHYYAFRTIFDTFLHISTF